MTPITWDNTWSHQIQTELTQTPSNNQKKKNQMIWWSDEWGRDRGIEKGYG